jgi:thiol:disulfide interchange protein DsbD
MRLLLCALAWLALVPAMAQPVRAPHIEVELVSDATSVQPGVPLTVALRLSPDPHWHTYWRNPGDSGLPTRIGWTLVDGAGVGPIQWPFPESIPLGHLTNYGYHGEVLLLTEIQPPDYLAAGTDFPVIAEAQWLVCEEICIPGEARLTLNLPVSHQATAPDPVWAEAFTRTRQRLPETRPDWRARFQLSDGRVALLVETPEAAFANVSGVAWFPIAEDLVAYAAPQRTELTADSLRLLQAPSAYLAQPPEAVPGVLVVATGRGNRAYEFTARHAPPPALDQESRTPAQTPIPAVLLGALAGGLILNLMPCVFPVLSLKALNLATGGHGSSRGRRRHGLVYGAGVLLSFMAVALLLLLLRAGGEEIGWGFQLQSAGFVTVMIYLVFVVGLNLSGVFEITPAGAGAGQGLAQRSGYAGSFFTGVLAVAVASPCTAPFMGPAIGFALTQSALMSLAVFGMLGLGMALPFIVLAWMPGIGRWLPPPGPWMLGFKQALAFPMYLTAVWLLWVLGRQTGVETMALTLCGLVLAGFSLWLWGQSGRRRYRGAALAGLIMALALPLGSEFREGQAPTHWQAYTPARLAALRAEGRPVFVNMTADWCLTCLANEQVALSDPRVTTRLQDLGVTYLKGDWTLRDPEITALLAGFGRSGVPLYVLYPGPPEIEPVVLPQLLTPTIVLDALEKSVVSREPSGSG